MTRNLKPSFEALFDITHLKPDFCWRLSPRSTGLRVREPAKTKKEKWTHQTFQSWLSEHLTM